MSEVATDQKSAIDQYIEENRTKREAKRKEWTKRDEHELKIAVSSALFAAKIPHVRECRCYDPIGIKGDHVSVDIAIFIQREGQELLQPFIAVELKNKNSRDEAMRGAGQCLTYLASGFDKAILATPYCGLASFSDGLERVGIIELRPEDVVEWIVDEFYESAGKPIDGKWRYKRPGTPGGLMGQMWRDMMEQAEKSSNQKAA